MSDDIVTRLREWHTAWDWYLPDEAADKIERLRAELDKWRHLARQLYDFIPETSNETLYRANVLRNFEDSIHAVFEQAVRGE